MDSLNEGYVWIFEVEPTRQGAKGEIIPQYGFEPASVNSVRAYGLALRRVQKLLEEHWKNYGYRMGYILGVRKKRGRKPTTKDLHLERLTKALGRQIEAGKMPDEWQLDEYHRLTGKRFVDGGFL
jgi:hypothetical protein